MKQRIEELLQEIQELKAQKLQDIEEYRIRLLGKKGAITKLFEDFREVLPEQKRELGQKLNSLKNMAASKLEELKEKVEDAVQQNAPKFDFPIHRPYAQLTAEQKELLWKGNRYFTGIRSFFEMVESMKYKIQYKYLLSRYSGKTVCPACHGSRLKKESEYVKIGGKSISELMSMSIDRLCDFFSALKLDKYEEQVAKRAIKEITRRLDCIKAVGLGYLTLSRYSNTLSGGESQRISLVSSLGNSLIGSLYILDEPSIGLHRRDTGRLIEVIKNLRDLGNTVVIVEHDAEIIKSA